MKSPTLSPISDQAAGEPVKEFESLCDLIPEDAYWGMPLTPDLVRHIRASYIATLPADWHVDSSLATWFPLTAKELESATRIFHDACHDLGLINEALGLDPDDGGAEPILGAIAELKGVLSTAPTTGCAPIALAGHAEWKLVPVKPTADMAKAGMDQWDRTFTQHDLYVAMVKAAPSPIALAGDPVAEIVRWKTFTGHYGWDIKIFDKGIEHGTKLYAAPSPSASSVPVTPAATWREKGEPDPHGKEYECERAALTLGKLTDDELANGVFMNADQPLDISRVLARDPNYHPPIVWLTAAKERIRWLSRALLQANGATK